MESIGIKPGVTMAFLAGLSELVGGILFTLGFLPPLAGIFLALTTAVAIIKVHAPNGFLTTQNGFEFNMILLIETIAVAIMGPGQYALD